MSAAITWVDRFVGVGGKNKINSMGIPCMSQSLRTAEGWFTPKAFIAAIFKVMHGSSKRSEWGGRYLPFLKNPPKKPQSCMI